jgi:multiple sugar transport system permease protein
MSSRTATPSPVIAPSPTRVAIRKGAGKISYYALVFFVVIVIAFPIYWIAASAFRPSKDSTHYPPSLIPHSLTMTAFDKLFAKQPVWHWLWNSTFIALIATAICVILAVLGAWIISMMSWRGRTLFAIFLLVTQMLPEALIVVPIFKIYSNFPILHWDLRNHLPALSLLDVAFILPIGIWVLKNLFDTVPREVLEASRVDGAGPFRMLSEIILPMTLPGLVAVGVVAFFYAWNEYLFAQLLTTNKALYPASVGLASMKTMLDTPIEQMLSAGLLFAIPPVLFYLLMQRYIVAGITAGAVKG